MTSWLDRLKKNPIDWLLEKSCPPIQYRALTEILGEHHGSLPARLFVA